MKTTFRFWGDDYPVISELTGGWSLIGHPNGPAICDGDYISVIDIYTCDSWQIQAIKREAQSAFRVWAWPKLKHTLALPDFSKPGKLA